MWTGLAMGNNRAKYLIYRMKTEEKGDQKISSKKLKC